MFALFFAMDGIAIADSFSDCDEAWAWFDTLRTLYPIAAITLVVDGVAVRSY